VFSNRSRQILKIQYFQNYYIYRYQILHNDTDNQVLFVDVQVSPKQIQGGERLPS